MKNLSNHIDLPHELLTSIPSWWGGSRWEKCQYAKNDRISVIKLVTWDVVLSSTVIPKVLLTRSLISRVAVVWTKSKNLWDLCISDIWRVFQRSSNVQGIDIILKRSSKLTIRLGFHSWKPDWKEICNRRQSASTVFPVIVAEPTLAKQADL
jgi:hypothetical protein